MNVLVSGGTGSFGNAFVRAWLKCTDSGRVVIFSRDELKQSQMQQALVVEMPKESERLRFLIGDVRDSNRLHQALVGIDCVIHAAAMKQVPTSEYNPAECIKTNILGAMNLIDAAVHCQVQRVMALSTDKSPQALNLYGKTKAVAESLFIQANVYSLRTRFACVRYGNVWGSRGSVIPLWRSQGDCITVTDPQMTRFFLTLQQGVDLVISSLDLMQGGEIFVPKIPSFSIGDLAKVVCPDASWDVIGLRPGEKMHETLISADEARQAWDAGDRFILYPALRLWPIQERGVKVPEGFAYSSDNNPERLGKAELAEWLSRMS